MNFEILALAQDTNGATMVEYCVMLAMIAGVSIAIVGVLGTAVGSLYSSVKWW